MKLKKLKNMNKEEIERIIKRLKKEGRDEDVKNIKAAILKTCSHMGKIEMTMVDTMVALYPMIIGQTIAWLFKKFVLKRLFKI